jgi:glucose/arabinose dehydrogenase
MDFVTSYKYPGLKGDLLVGWHSFQYLHRCDVEEGGIVKQEKYFKGIGRVRVIRQGPSGFLYFGVEGKGIVRLVNNF